MHDNFLAQLKNNLSSSTGQQRADWAKTIVMESIRISDLFVLLDGDVKTAKRFLWLLSNVGMWDKAYLRNALPNLLELSDQYEHLGMKESMISYWRNVGIPETSETDAINLLFTTLNSAQTNVTMKSRAMWALEPLMAKYPDILPEFKSILELELGKYGADYDKKVMKVLKKL